MDKELKKAVKYLLSRLESTEKFVLEKAPEVFKEMVERKILAEKLEAYQFGTASLLSAALSVYLGVSSYLSDTNKYGDPSDKQILLGVSSLILAVISAIALTVCINSIKEYCLTKKYPNIFLLDKIRRML